MGSDSSLIRDLAALIGTANVSQSDVDRVTYSRDMWPKSQIWVMQGSYDTYSPAAIVWPHTTQQLSRILNYLNSQGIPAIPYGGGSGVCGGTLPIHGGVLIDVKKMNSLTSLSSINQSATFETGIIGQHLEMALNRKEYTLGHFPTSIYCSTLGGWLASRSAGQYSSKYGKVEDMVISMEVVLADGTILQTESSPYPFVGLNWNQLFLGSEGTLGVISKAKLKIHPRPAKQVFKAYYASSIEKGLEAMRLLMQNDLTPCLLKLYDEIDTILSFPHGFSSRARSSNPLNRALRSVKNLWFVGQSKDYLNTARNWIERQALSHPLVLNKLVDLSMSRCLLLVGFEGAEPMVQTQASIAEELLKELNLEDLGSQPGWEWYRNRYQSAYVQSRIYAIPAFVDTIEVATTWDRLYPLYKSIRHAMNEKVLLMAQFCHAFTEGCSIYFTFSGSHKDPHQLEKIYDSACTISYETVTSHGATISHHHGVGMSRAWFEHPEFAEARHIFVAIKDALDPGGIMNPGKLWHGSRQ